MTDTDPPLAALTPDLHNDRRHDGRTLVHTADALCDVGGARSVVVDEPGTVLAGLTATT